MHTDCFDFVEYLPKSHLEHSAFPSNAYDPFSHIVCENAPRGHACPALHVWHNLIVILRNSPPGHSKHELSPSTDDLPFLHAVQNIAPLSEAKKPALHGWQYVEALLLEKVPLSHRSHLLLPDTLVNRPCGHW